MVAEALSSEEERVRRGLARAQSWVVRSDRYFGRDDIHSAEATMRCSNNSPVSPVATEMAGKIARKRGKNKNEAHRMSSPLT